MLKIGVVLVNNQKMRQLNKKYRGKDKAVKVLAFPFDEKQPDGIYFLGEIVVNKDQVSTKEELLELINHGAKNLLKNFQ
jgi:probable rRNA maturation factor